MSLQVPIPPLNSPITSDRVSLVWASYFSSLKEYTDALNLDVNNIFHNALKGLQGGTINEHYHLTTAQHVNLSKIPTFSGNSGSFLNSSGLFSVPSHNSTEGIQGGEPSGYYHLTLSDYNKLKNSVMPILSGSTVQFFNGAGQFTVPKHNETNGIQGGAVNDYQHLTTAEANNIRRIRSFIFGYMTLGL